MLVLTLSSLIVDVVTYCGQTTTRSCGSNPRRSLTSMHCRHDAVREHVCCMGCNVCVIGVCIARFIHCECYFQSDVVYNRCVWLFIKLPRVDVVWPSVVSGTKSTADTMVYCAGVFLAWFALIPRRVCFQCVVAKMCMFHFNPYFLWSLNFSSTCDGFILSVHRSFE
jgi:hypothetical protein